MKSVYLLFVLMFLTLFQSCLKEADFGMRGGLSSSFWD